MGFDRDIGKKMLERNRNAVALGERHVSTPEEDAEIARSIIDGTFKGTVYLGEDPDYTIAALKKYGLKGLNAACHPEDYPLD